MNINNDILLSRLDSLCAEKGISLNVAFVESGVGKNFKSNLKTANPSIGKITMLANYFGVTVDYLIGETDEKSIPSLSDKFDSLLEDLSIDVLIDIKTKIEEIIKNREQSHE